MMRLALSASATCHAANPRERDSKMSSDFEKMLEDKYILDFERAEQVRSRRNALLANWLAIRTKRNDVGALTAKVLKDSAAEAGDAGLCDRLLSDLKERGIAVDEAELRSTAHALLMEAAKQLAAEDETRYPQ